MEKEDFYQHLRVRDPYLQTPQNIPCQEKTNVSSVKLIYFLIYFDRPSDRRVHLL